MIWNRLPMPLSPAHLREGILICNVGLGLVFLGEVVFSHFFPHLVFSSGMRTTSGQVGSALGALVLFLIGVGVWRTPPSCDRLIAVPYTLFAVSFSTTLNVSNGTANAAAQVMTLLPGVFAGFHVPRRWGFFLASITVIAELILIWSTLPLAEAINDTMYMPVLILLMAIVMTAARTQQLANETALRRQAQEDVLTGLATRQLLDDALAGQLNDSAGSLGDCLVIVDLDHFKAINDAYGHPVGDRALIAIGECLKTEAYTAGDLAVRIGGDEFALLLTDVSPVEAIARARRVRERVRSTILPVGGQEVPLSVSIGAAHTCALDGEDRSELYTVADAALYRAKRGGRDRVEVITEPLTQELVREHPL